MENWEILLSSVVLASFISSIFTLIINGVKQNRSFRNDYYKLVINKRMEAYQYVDDQLKTMKLTVLDVDGRPYHFMFQGDLSSITGYQRDLLFAKVNGIWLSADMEDVLSELNQLLFEINDQLTDDINGNVALAKNYYSKISNTRVKVEEQLRTDMLELYKIKHFLTKKRKSGYITYHVKKRY